MIRYMISGAGLRMVAVVLLLGVVGSLGSSGGSASAQGDVFETTESESTVCDESTRLAYATTSGELWIVDADGCNRIRITDHLYESDFSFRWSPDGTRFAYIQRGKSYIQNGIRYTKSNELRIADPDGSYSITISELWGRSRFKWSPDGTRLAYTKATTTRVELWIVDSDGSNPIRISDESSSSPTSAETWSPDGTRLTYSTGYPAELWIVGSDGSNPVRIGDYASNVRWSHVRWSPDGTRLAYKRDRYPTSELWITDADGSNSVKITEQNWGHRFKWSPDGARIAYDESSSGLWITGRDGYNRTKITERVDRTYLGTDFGWSGTDFGWSPDGAHFAYETEPDDEMGSSHELWIADADGSNPIKISEMIIWHVLKAIHWSPDGTRFFYPTSKRDPSSGRYLRALWVADADGSNPKIVTDELRNSSGQSDKQAIDNSVGWSPDGTKTVYLTEDALWIADWDGSNPTQIAGDESIFRTWSPGGARIAYTVDRSLWIADSDGSNPTRIDLSERIRFYGWAPALVAGAAAGSVSSGGPSVAVSRGSVENDFEICRVGAAVCSWVVGSGSGWTPGEEFFVKCGDFVDTSRDVPVVYRDRFVDSGGGLSWGESICYSNGAHVVEVWTGADGSVSVTAPAPDGTVPSTSPPSTSPPSSTPPTTDPVVPASLPEIANVGHRLVEGKPVMTFSPPAGAVSYDLRYRASAGSEWTVAEGVDVLCYRGIDSGTWALTNWCSYRHPVAVPDGWWYALRGVSSSGRGPWSGPRSVDVPPPVSQPSSPSSSSSRTAARPPPERHPVLSGDNLPNVRGGSITVDLPVLEPDGGWSAGSDGGAHKGKFRYIKSDPYSAGSATWYFQDHDQALSSGYYRIEVFIPNRWRASFWRNKDADPLPTATVKYIIYSRDSTDDEWTGLRIKVNTFSVDQSNKSGWVRLGSFDKFKLQYYDKSDVPTGQLAVKLEVRDATGGTINVDRMRLTFSSLTDEDQQKVADRAAVSTMRQSVEEKALLGGDNLDDSLRYLCGQLDSGTLTGQLVKSNLETRSVIKGQQGVHQAAAELALNYYRGHWKSVLSVALNRAGLPVASLAVGLLDVAGAVDEFNKLMQADYLTEDGIETKACPLEPWDSKWD